ncbi:MAG: carbohydrate ABC transporter permease, partial [Gammaproteobacteria bacterium]
LGDPHWALPAIILMAVWKNFGYSMVVFLAGLHAIPGHLYEAARIDGANAWQQFRHITLPLLAPTTLFVAVLTLIGYLQLFAEPYVMTQGGPSQSTLSVVLLMYEEGFRWWNMGYAAAVAFLLFGIIVVGGVLLRRIQKRWVP